ncbi:MAG: OsmC family protein [Gemmatimonadales bacterium]
MRRHTALVDRPIEKGGADEGPMGGDYFLTAVGGCFMSTLLAAIRAREAAVSNVRTKVTGTLAQGPTRFTAIELEVSADHSDDELFAHLVDIAQEGCIMVQTLKRGVDLGVRVGATA